MTQLFCFIGWTLLGAICIDAVMFGLVAGVASQIKSFANPTSSTRLLWGMSLLGFGSLVADLAMNLDARTRLVSLGLGSLFAILGVSKWLNL